MSRHLFLSISTGNHESGIVKASLNTHPDAPNHRIVRLKPMRTIASGMAGVPCYVPIKTKPKRKRQQDPSDINPVTANTTSVANDMPPIKKARTDLDGRNEGRASVGGLLMNEDALKHPKQYNTAQIKWAESMADALLEGTMARYESLQIQLQDIAGDEWGRIITPVYKTAIGDLREHPTISVIAAMGTFVAQDQTTSLRPASADDMKDLDRLLDLLRTWFGRVRSLEVIVNGLKRVD